MRKIIIGAALAAATIGGVTASAAGAASASTSAVLAKAVTISPEHADTTGITCPACAQGPGGPIWASDQLKETVKVTSAGTAGHYNVVISFGGSTFHGFADPRAAGEAGSDGTGSGGPMLSQGAVAGSITYNDIASATAPDASNVAAVQAPDTGLHAVLDQMFHGAEQPAASIHYTVSYKPSLDGVDPTAATADTWEAGTVYTQSG